MTSLSLLTGDVATCETLIGCQTASRRRELQRQTSALLVRPSLRCPSIPRPRPRRPPAHRFRRPGRGRSADVDVAKSRVPGRREPPAVQRSAGHQRRRGRGSRWSADDLERCRRRRVVVVSSLRRRRCCRRCCDDDAAEAKWMDYRRPTAAADDAMMT